VSRIAKAKGEMLLKASGMHDSKDKHVNSSIGSYLDSDQYVVWDLTAGLGRDAFVMAAAGCRVHMFENNAVMYALLHDGLDRLKSSHNSALALIGERLHLHHLDSTGSTDSFKHELHAPSAMYLDPMYSSLESVDRKSKPKKETQILQRLTHLDYLSSVSNLDTNSASNHLLRVAMGKSNAFGNCRVFVKRSKGAKCLCDSLFSPAVVFSGSTQRFDVYMPQSTQ
jgi:16S rRNA (guanine1516-N2)-methyltransferase